MTDTTTTVIRQQLAAHAEQLDRAHATLRQHTVEIAELMSDRDDHERRLVDDRDLLADLQQEIAGIHGVARQTLTKLGDHAAHDQLALIEQTAAIEKLSKRLVRLGSILALVVAVVSAVATVIVMLGTPDSALDLLRRALSISTGAPGL